MSIKKFFYLSEKTFKRNIKINSNIFIFLFLFVFCINILSSVLHNISETQLKAEESSLTVRITKCTSDEITDYFDELVFSDIYTENDDLIIKLCSVSDTYMIISVLKQMNYEADYYNSEYEYNSQSAGYLIKYLNVVYYLLLVCICVTLFILLYKKNISDKMKYVLYICLGYKWNDVVMLLTIEMLLIIITSSVSGFLFSIPANILANKMLKDHLLCNEVYDTVTILSLETILFVIAVLVITLTLRHLRKKSLSSFMERKM